VSHYLRTLGVDVPQKPSRYPTPKEVRDVCGALSDFNVEMFSPPDHAWQIVIQGINDADNEPWTMVNISSFNGDENAPHHLSFSKGWPSLILRIVRALTVHCGPLAGC